MCRHSRKDKDEKIKSATAFPLTIKSTGVKEWLWFTGTPEDAKVIPETTDHFIIVSSITAT